MTNYKETKWAERIVELQKDNGSWGYFHSLSIPTLQQHITTEQALKRLRILGFTKDDAVIEKAISYMQDCLLGKKITPDRREKGLDWDIFTELMLAVRIRQFDRDDVLAGDVAKK